MCLEDRPVLEPNAAGIDVGAREMFVAVPPGVDEHPVRVFTTFTEDLHRLADWLAQCGVTTVAMEATGVYWIPLYEILEQREIRPCLVNARHMKNVPGRRTDWHECQWLQFLHSVGLLRAAFRPEEDICAVRTVLRHRSELVMAATQHMQHIHKALTQMNLQIHHVISDITGATGLAIVDAILAGQRDPAELAKLQDVRIKADPETIRKSLVGNWRAEHLFTLQAQGNSAKICCGHVAILIRQRQYRISSLSDGMCLSLGGGSRVTWKAASGSPAILAVRWQPGRLSVLFLDDSPVVVSWSYSDCDEAFNCRSLRCIRLWWSECADIRVAAIAGTHPSADMARRGAQCAAGNRAGDSTTREKDHFVAGKPWTYVERVSRPTMTVYSPTGKNTGAAVVVFPGGGYWILAIDLEGTEVCDWLAAKGSLVCS